MAHKISFCSKILHVLCFYSEACPAGLQLTQCLLTVFPVYCVSTSLDVCHNVCGPSIVCCLFMVVLVIVCQIGSGF